MNEFWIDYWPNFVATISGLLIGIPISLWLDRKITSWRERDKREEERQRIIQASEMLFQAFDGNNAQMKSLEDTVRQKMGKENLEIDYTAWDAIKPDVIHYLHNPTLQYGLSRHFSRMEYLVKVSDMYTSYQFGIESAVITKKNRKRIVKALVEYLLDLIPELIEEANKLRCDLEKETLNIQQNNN